MALVVRPMRVEEARTFFDIHTRAIRGLAASYYPPEVIAAWAGNITEGTIQRFLGNPDGEVRLIAELDGVGVGLGCLVVPHAELRACYVVPEAARKGVGSALVREMERIAMEHGLDHLALHASINAEPFYRALGYEAISRDGHVLGSGLRMAAVTMRKTLGSGAR